MGKIIKVNLADIRITQNYLISEKVKKYYVNSSNVVPVPVAHDFVGKNFVALDGHHYLASCYLRNQTEINVWLCDSPHDFIDGKKFSNYNIDNIQQRNEQIRARYDTAPFYVPSIKGVDIFMVKDLVDKLNIQI
jgi:hypothetical protein